LAAFDDGDSNLTQPVDQKKILENRADDGTSIDSEILIASEVGAYLNVTSTGFIDGMMKIIKRRLFHMFVEELNSILYQDLIKYKSEEEIRSMMEEEEVVVKQRDELTAKKKILRTVREQLMQFS